METNVATAKEIEDTVREIVAETLAVGPDEVVPSARFFEDLGAESIDLLDLSFRCEKQFGVKIPFADFGRLDEFPTDGSGKLTPEGLASLEAKFPFLDYAQLREDPQVSRLTEMLTVGAITRFVQFATSGQEKAE
jgi:acyl carrier protein